MTDLSSLIEAKENRLMRAWVGRDVRALKALTSRRFRMVIGSKPAVILDARSWLDAASNRFCCASFSFGDIYSRQLGSAAVFAAQLEMRAEVDRRDWSGNFWMTDLWMKSPVRRNWVLTERTISRIDTTPDIPAAVRGLQLWR